MLPESERRILGEIRRLGERLARIEATLKERRDARQGRHGFAVAVVSALVSGGVALAAALIQAGG